MSRLQNLGGALIILTIVGSVVYAAVEQLFPSYLIPAGVLFALFAVGVLLVAWGLESGAEPETEPEAATRG